MSDIPYINSLSLINEELKNDILKGKALDILLLLLSGSRTIKEISKDLDVPSFSIQLYIKRLIEAKLIKIVNTRVVDGKLEKTYELISSDVEILNYIQENNPEEQESNINLSAQHFATMTRNIITNVNNYKEKPHKIKAYFIKSDEDTIKSFKEELELLYEKYQSLEDLNADDTYGFISVLAPYDISEKE